MSDRLVTLGQVPVDPIANKNVLYVAPDGIVCLGYTGVAYLGDCPTDQWIVEKITGLTFDRPRPPMFRMCALPRWLTVGLMVRSLGSALTDRFSHPRTSRIARNTFFEVAGVGWQWRRNGRARPILFGVVKLPGFDSFRCWYGQRHIGWQFLFSATPNGNADLLEGPSFKKALRGIRSVDEAEAVLVRGVREVAAKTSVVGSDCMSVLLPPPAFGKARVRYVGAPAEAAVVQSGTGAVMRTLPAVYCPWIVGPGGVVAPSIVSGRKVCTAGTFKIEIDAPAPSGQGVHSVMGAIARPALRGV